MHFIICFFFLCLRRGGYHEMLVGRICWWWFCSTEVKWSTLCFMSVYALSALLKLACQDSAPCSPIQPNPTFHCFSHGMTWLPTCAFWQNCCWKKGTYNCFLRGWIYICLSLARLCVVKRKLCHSPGLGQ